LSERLKNRYLR